MVYLFNDMARLAAEGDNTAIAVSPLAKGDEVRMGDTTLHISDDVLEGHRFAVCAVDVGDKLISWGLPFGEATRRIPAGGYLCNPSMLDVLSQRLDAGAATPDAPNFENHVDPYVFEPKSAVIAKQVPVRDDVPTFMGFDRGAGRGVGTRNTIVVLGTSSAVSGAVRALALRFKGVPAAHANIDGVVAVAHTEGGGRSRPNNLELVLRSLGGYMVHPNVGAVIAIDYPGEQVNNVLLRNFIDEHALPLDKVLHDFFSIGTDLNSALDEAEVTVRAWLDEVNKFERTPQSASRLSIALQCGGSDAFSGISGNPLAGWLARETIQCGGQANLAETDELNGAEPYILKEITSARVAEQFLATAQRFRDMLAWHGNTAEGNISGGNIFRGLYNNTLKSIGAARKKAPDVLLDHIIDYAVPMTGPGMYFMDSPGNDLESVAGQVAAGCNLILFVTGNGSVTNFPFVPTLKIVTTTARYQLLEHEMDINAGRYLDGTDMDELGRDAFELLLKTASGDKTAGERAGHSQVQIWREWRQKDAARLGEILALAPPENKPLPVHSVPASSVSFSMCRWGPEALPALQRVALIMPTSLCSGEVARMIAAKLDAKLDAAGNVSKVIALAHTEGCGTSSVGPSGQLYLQTLAGYICHPSVACALLLEHGCEKTHNDHIRQFMAERSVPAERFGWASIQLDGGIEKVTTKAEAWLGAALEILGPAPPGDVGLEAVRIAVLSVGRPTSSVTAGVAHVVAAIASAGGTVVVPQGDALCSGTAFVNILKRKRDAGKTTLSYGEQPIDPGLHIMETQTDHVLETMTGLGATGVEMIMVYVSGPPVTGHPMIPVVQFTSDADTAGRYGRDLDLVLSNGSLDRQTVYESLLVLMQSTMSCQYIAKSARSDVTAFQITRGLLGFST